MEYQFNTSDSSKKVVNFALLFFWISFPLTAYIALVSMFGLLSGKALPMRAIVSLFASLYGLFIAITIPLQIANQYNRIRVSEEGLYIEVYVFRYIWKLVGWKDVLELKLLPTLDRWRKPQWIIRVRHLTYWHRWVSWQYKCGSDPGILVNSDLLNREKLLEIVESKLHVTRVY